VTTIAVISAKGGVGKTTLAYHLAWMYADLGLRVLAVDLDPQANLTARFLGEGRLQELSGATERGSIYAAIKPVLEGTGHVLPPHLEAVVPNLGVLPGNVALSGLEPELSNRWAEAPAADVRTLVVVTALASMVSMAADRFGADIVLMDVAPSLSAINRAALLAADYVVIPLLPDALSALGLRVLGPELIRWREQWRVIRERAEVPDLLPNGDMCPAGYTVGSPTSLHTGQQLPDNLLRRISTSFHESVLCARDSTAPEPDPYLLGVVRRYRSLEELAREANKPVFSLTPADGAIGSHAKAVQQSYQEFRKIAQNLARRCKITLHTVTG
jgi:chromosome partitioning protein